MKASSSPNSTDPSSGPENAVPVLTQLQAIDLSQLDQLLDLRREQARFEELRARAAQIKSTVEDVVRRRVVDDYAQHAAALHAKAAPLVGQVRAGYQEICALVDRVHATQQAATLEKNEIEFRREVGELSDAVRTERLASPEKILARCETDLKALGEGRARFLEALGSEAEPDHGHADPPAPPAPPIAAVPSSSASVRRPSPVSEAAPVMAAAAAQKTGPVQPHGAPSDPPLSPQATRPVTVPAAIDVTQPLESYGATIIHVDALGAPEAPAGVAGGKRPSSPDSHSEDQTFLLPRAIVIVNPHGATPVQHHLGALNYIGRSADSQIQLATPGVSRRHAVITPAAGVFLLKDLQSQNGTFVNGDRITEHQLTDGDQIVIGDAELIFHALMTDAAPPKDARR